jgi:hemerythrin-like metal-binding protein
MAQAGEQIGAEAVTLYAQALEVQSHGGDVRRLVFSLELPADERQLAEDAHVQLCRMTRDYDVGIVRMNDEHSRIFEYINALHGRIKDKAAPRELLVTLREFADFTRQHFAREEELMTRASYPGLAGQQRAHQKLLKQVGEFIASVESSEKVDLIGMLAFFREWLIDHILVMDKKYSAHLNERGIY